MGGVLIVDDHPAFRHQARALLESEGLEVVGEASDGRSAVTAVRTLGPDVVLLDIGLPGMDGFEVAELLARDPAPPSILLISSREAWTYGGRIAASPVAGFIRKDALSAAAIREILRALP